jgi:membrane protein implicated in regulation of membrane protease activity
MSGFRKLGRRLLSRPQSAFGTPNERLFGVMARRAKALRTAVYAAILFGVSHFGLCFAILGTMLTPSFLSEGPEGTADTVHQWLTLTYVGTAITSALYLVGYLSFVRPIFEKAVVQSESNNAVQRELDEARRQNLVSPEYTMNLLVGKSSTMGQIAGACALIKGATIMELMVLGCHTAALVVRTIWDPRGTTGTILWVWQIVAVAVHALPLAINVYLWVKTSSISSDVQYIRKGMLWEKRGQSAATIEGQRIYNEYDAGYPNVEFDDDIDLQNRTDDYEDDTF